MNITITKEKLKSNIIYILIILILTFFNIYQYNINRIVEYKEVVKTDTIVRVDTLTYEKPIPKYITQINTIKDTLKTTDTIPQYVEVEVPIESKTYEDSTYYAVISGFKANLDTLKVFPRETTITIEKTLYKQKKGISIKPSINCGVGYGFINKKPDVFVGGGVSIIFN